MSDPVTPGDSPVRVYPVAVAADHAGWVLKNHLSAWLIASGFPVKDLGTEGPERVDYPDFARRAVAALETGTVERAILICGTGIGMAMTANRIKGIRAAVCSEAYSAMMARCHNDAQVLCLGARVVGPGLAEHIVHAFLTATFEGGRHVGRVAKIDGVG